jgi:hypothetical protein
VEDAALLEDILHQPGNRTRSPQDQSSEQHHSKKHNCSSLQAKYHNLHGAQKASKSWFRMSRHKSQALIPSGRRKGSCTKAISKDRKPIEFGSNLFHCQVVEKVLLQIVS